MKILAVDYGDARTGLASCDKSEMLASPLQVIHQKDSKKTIATIAAIAKEELVEQIVVGHPKNMDGSLGERAQLCEDFAKELQEASGIPTLLWDERSTTVSAIQVLNTTNTRGQRRKNVIDAVAATIILDSYMNYRRLHPATPVATGRLISANLHITDE